MEDESFDTQKHERAQANKQLFKQRLHILDITNKHI